MKKLLLIVIVLISFQSFGQLWQNMPQYGYTKDRDSIRLVLRIPTDTTNNKSGIVKIGSTLYAGNGTYWTSAGGAGSTPTWQQSLTQGPALTGNNTIAGGGYNFTFGNMGLFTISQNAKSAVTGANGTANISPLTITGGNGGASSYSTGTVAGGDAGAINITGGNGGAITGTPTTGVGGTGSQITVLAGDGGLGTTNGGTGGFVEIQGGTGGGGTAGGSAGYVALKAGNAGSTGGAQGGHIYIVPGIGQGAGGSGEIFLGLSPSATVRGNVTIGSATAGTQKLNVTGSIYSSALSSGMVKNTSGVLQTAVAGTDYQAPLTNPVTGTGTTDQMTKFTAAGVIGNSLLTDNGSTTIGFPVSAGIFNIGGGATAAELRFLEPSGSGSNYSSFKSVAQGSNITYSLPATIGGAGTFLRDAAGNGVLDWATPSGTIGGSIAVNQVAYGSGTNTITGDAAFTWDGTKFVAGRGYFSNNNSEELFEVVDGDGSVFKINADSKYILFDKDVTGLYKVGISTPLPDSTLTVVGSGHITTNLLVDGRTWMNDRLTVKGSYFITGTDPDGDQVNIFSRNTDYFGFFGDGNGMANNTSVTWDDAAQVITINAANGVGITGTTQFTGNVGIGVSPTEALDVNGNILASGTITPSDFRYKQNIKSFDNGLSLINKLNPTTYEYKQGLQRKFNTGTQFGLIAQEVEKIIPEVVTTGKDGYKAINYTELIPILIKAVQELNNKVDMQQQEIYELKRIK